MAVSRTYFYLAFITNLRGQYKGMSWVWGTTFENTYFLYYFITSGRAIYLIGVELLRKNMAPFGYLRTVAYLSLLQIVQRSLLRFYFIGSSTLVGYTRTTHHSFRILFLLFSLDHSKLLITWALLYPGCSSHYDHCCPLEVSR